MIRPIASAQDLFAASAGPAGVLIGFVFVAIPVPLERVLGPQVKEDRPGLRLLRRTERRGG